MPNFQEGKLYKVYNTITEDIYIGSTTQKLCERLSGHRRHFRSNRVDMLLYQAFEEHGVDDFCIEPIGEYPCNGKDELSKQEGGYIWALKPTLNKIIAGRTRT